MVGNVKSDTVRMNTTAKLSRSKLQFIEAAGNLCQELGIPRSLGQIYGLLYLGPKALSLDDISNQLSISKASASGGTRKLIQWQAIRQVWIPGDRRDFFEARGDLNEITRSAYKSVIKAKLEKSVQKLDQFSAALEEDYQCGILENDDYEHCRKALTRIATLQSRVTLLLPILEKLIS